MSGPGARLAAIPGDGCALLPLRKEVLLVGGGDLARVAPHPGGGAAAVLRTGQLLILTHDALAALNDGAAQAAPRMRRLAADVERTAEAIQPIRPRLILQELAETLRYHAERGREIAPELEDEARQLLGRLWGAR